VLNDWLFNANNNDKGKRQASVSKAKKLGTVFVKPAHKLLNKHKP